VGRLSGCNFALRKNLKIGMTNPCHDEGFFVLTIQKENCELVPFSPEYIIEFIHHTAGRIRRRNGWATHRCRRISEHIKVVLDKLLKRRR